MAKFDLIANGTGPTDYTFSSMLKAIEVGERLVDSGLYWMISIRENNQQIIYYHRNHKEWMV
jgi:hypothetical protein